jgi:DNA polymerase-3 subunit alpha
MTFSHLHLHTQGSAQDGIQKAEQIVAKAVSLGMPAVAVTDHGRCGELLRLKKECLKAGIKPIYGTEQYISPACHTIKEKIDGHNKTSYHLTLLAKSHQGLKNIFKISSEGWLNGFYYKPRVSNDVLRRHSEGLVVLSGCSAGRASIKILEGDIEAARQNLIEYRDMFGDDFYVEVQNHNLPWQADLNEELIKLSNELSIPYVITQDSHYLNQEDAELHKYVTKLAAGDLEFLTDQVWFKSREEMELMFDKKHHHALDRTVEIANKCNCEWETGKTIWPIYPLPKDKTPEQELRELTWKGFKEKFNTGTKEYINRLNYELDVIVKMGFPTYFLVVQDFIDWARKNGIGVGSGRGSSAGSLAAYCLGITEVDPIKYGLIFERFLNPGRVDSPPDIDTDIDASRRDEVIEYVKSKYGFDYVSNIGTASVFKPRGSIRSFARVMGYEDTTGARLAGYIPPDMAGKTATFAESIIAEPRLLAPETKPLIDMAMRAEGIKNQFGVHAAGVIVSDRPITDYLPLFVGRNGKVAAQFDMGEVEEIGLVKFDFLGLKNLGVIQEAIQLIKKHHDLDIDLSSIEDGDEKTYNTVFKTGNLDGVFQFETSSGFKDLCIKIEPKNIDDLAVITSLYRPGPLALKLTDRFVECRRGQELEYFIPELEPIISDTYAIIIYQEQIMKICTDIAGYTLVDADNMRKVLGKKLVEKMKLERSKFVDGCIHNGIDEEKAEKLFHMLDGFSLYSFNRSHACAYSFTSYRTAWLKAHYPLEFYTALLNNAIEKDQDSIVKYVWSAKENGIIVMPPDINKSEPKFSIDNGCIVFGFAGVKGIGDKAAEQIIAIRGDREFQDLNDLIQSGINQGTLKNLAESGSFSEIVEIPRKQITEILPAFIDYNDKLNKWEEQKIKFEENEKERMEATMRGEKPPRRRAKLKDKPVAPILTSNYFESKEERLAYERKTLGLYISGHPLDSYPRAYKAAKNRISDMMENSVLNGDFISVPAVISSIVEKRTRSKTNMGVLKIEDKTARIEATIFPKKWAELKDLIIEDAPCIISGRVEKIETDDPDSIPATKLIVNHISMIDKESAVKTNFNFSLRDGTSVEVVCGENANITRVVSILKSLRSTNG